MINDMGIQVFENAPDNDTLMMSEANTDEDAAEAAAQALATVESEIGRTTDPYVCICVKWAQLNY